MEEEIIQLLGKKQGRTVELIDVEKYEEVHGIYHWRGTVCCLKNGRDIDFKDLSEKEQTEVYNQIKLKRFKINNTIQ